MTAVASGPALLGGSRARRLCAAAAVRTAAWAALALAVVVSGCAADAGPSSGSSSGEPLAALSATVKQYREDEIAGRLQVSLTNQGARTAVVASVRLESADFAPAEASRPQLHLAPGQRTDVPVAYGSIRCDGTVRRTASRAIVHVDVSRPGAAAVPLALEVPPTP